MAYVTTSSPSSGCAAHLGELWPRTGSLVKLSDEDVQEGIRWLLQRDRCVEEEKRLGRERCYLQEWASEEWNALERLREGLDDESDCDMVFAVDCRMEALRELIGTWRFQVQLVTPAWPMPESWGPVRVDVGMEAGQVGDDMEDLEDVVV
ncbi:hypothetical protein HYDPIDRAFT_34039 [Hydnomerulius pinastri MD-312]|uniref:Uncharacterized protein n=1 Tax=Hydnomerulius pinastri MD-312 TaxID=994086 RepID=A0A0C9VYV5_9AGAM|nr:hypothetical protein HYDPIDRAFT_34039 [Hydnomerulius pinastri MD-312]